MSSLSLEKLGQNLPATGLTGVSQAAVGFGAGLLVAGYLNSKVRDKLAVGLMASGAAIVLPVVIGIISRVVNNPNSDRRVRAQMESIRTNDGYSDTEF